MKIQLACDFNRTEDALELLEKVVDDVDIIEVGTDLMFGSGSDAIRRIKSKYPNKTLLADLKVMDGGRELGELVFNSGADIMTVLGVAPKETIQAACECAKKYGKHICVDMINVTDQVSKAKEFVSWGAELLCVHTADDQKENVTFYHMLKDYVQEVGADKCSIAGGMNPTNIKEIRKYNPEVIVVGGYITGSSDPKKAVLEIRDTING